MFLLNNLGNHSDGVGGWTSIEAVELVGFGPALPRGGVVKVMELLEQGDTYIRP